MWSPLDILSLETWILIATLLCLARFYLHRKWQFLKKLNIPHYPPSILKIGTLRYNAKPSEFFTSDLEMKKKFGMVYGQYMGWSPRIVISDPDILKQIMIKEFNNFYDRQKSLQKVNGKALNNGLTNITGDTWRRVRHTISPMFSTSKLRSMIGVIDKCADEMVENLQSIAKDNDGVFDTKGVFGKYTLSAICSAAFGVDVNSQKDEKESKAIRMAKKLFQAKFLSNPMLYILIIFPWMEKIAEKMDFTFFPRDALKYFENLTNSILKISSSPDPKQTSTVLQLLAESEISEKETKSKTKGLTHMEITGNGVLMILAGYETTSSAIIFLAFNLAWHKDVQEKLREEIREIVKSDNSLDYEKLNGLKYLTQCINESLRLYPPAPRNGRYCEKKITINGITIPGKIHIDIPTYGMARDPEYWDEPEKYIPERMDDMSKIDPIIFQPFGAGPRNCIGLRLALMKIRLAICKVLLNFELDVCPDTPKPPIEIIIEATMRPKVDVLHLKAIPLK
uniref:Cytochrome P450 3A14 n=1 Tax=Phallusia mammillata TaxID=59560 RepID=A0A6F9DAL1_9ASCI|nr:cytochrome P450 3A14 [Phallusia mammillata]